MQTSTGFQFATANKIVFGTGSFDQLGELARPFGDRVLLVLGRGRRYEERALKLLQEAGVQATISHISSEPTIEDATRLVLDARTANARFVIGIGGGSVIDGAKAVAALMNNPGEPLDYLEVVGKGLPLKAASAPYLAVPTTSGTGAEVTKNAVLSSQAHHVKVSLRSDSMLPEIALVDPELSLSMPAALTASTGLDALTQVLEPFVSCAANPLTDALSFKGLEHARTAIRRVFHHPDDLAARTDMALVSLLGGLSLANAKLGAVHGFAGPLGGMFPIPHGIACARLLPIVFRQNVISLTAKDSSHPVLKRYQIVARVLTDIPTATALDGAAWLDDLVTELEIPPLRHYGVTHERIETVVTKAQRASSMKGNPIELTQAELCSVLARAI